MSIENEFSRKLSKISQEKSFSQRSPATIHDRAVIERLFATIAAKLLSDLEQ